MIVNIFGPNLRDESRGTFHVHRAGCQDAKHYGPGRKFGGEDEGWTVDVDSRVDVVECVYDNQLDEHPDVEAADWLSDFYFAPCVKDLKVSSFLTDVDPGDEREGDI